MKDKIVNVDSILPIPTGTSLVLKFGISFPYTYKLFSSRLKVYDKNFWQIRKKYLQLELILTYRPGIHTIKWLFKVSWEN